MCFLAAAHSAVAPAHSVRAHTDLLLRVGTVALGILFVLRLTVGRRRRILLLMIVAAVALLLLMRAVVAVTLAAVVVVAGHGDCVWLYG